MDVLTQFGFGDELYTFDTTQQISLRDNFRDAVARTTRLPGVVGGYDEYGTKPAPNEIGNVQVNFWIEADTPAAIQTLKQQVGSMKAWGKRQLWKQPWGSAAARFCEARINSVSFSENAKDVPHRRIRVQVDFQVDYPFWLGMGTHSAFWGGGDTWGGGELWGGSPVEEVVSGTDNTFSLTPGGNDLIYPRVAVLVGAGDQAEDVRIQRIRGGRVQDEIRYTGTLAAGDVLDVDCMAYKVKLNGASAYNSAFSIVSPAWFRLRGGLANEIRVLMANSGDEATIQFKYFEPYNV